MSTSPANDTANHGHLRVSGRRFVFEDGTLFFPRGLSLMGVNPRAMPATFRHLWNTSPEQWLDLLAENGVNFLRLHMSLHDGTPGAFETWPIPEANPAHRHALEEHLPWYLEQCQSRGIYVCVNISHFAEFTAWEAHPYSTACGGPCQSLRDLVTHPAALDLFRRRIDCYAQFCDFRSFALWEVVNELDNGPTTDFGTDGTTADWVLGLARHCSQADPHRHPVGASLYPGTDPVSAPFFQAVQGDTAIDWISVHSYSGDFVAQSRHPFVLGTGKPILSTESFELSSDGPYSFSQGGPQLLTWRGLAAFGAELEWSDGMDLDHPYHKKEDDAFRAGFPQLLSMIRAAALVLKQTVEADSWADPRPAAISPTLAVAASTDGHHLMAYFDRSLQIPEFIPPQTRLPLSDLPPGRYDVRWFLPDTGRLIAHELRDFATTPHALYPGGRAFLYVRPA